MNDEALALCLVVPRIPHADQIYLYITLESGLVGKHTVDGDGSSFVYHTVCISSSISIPTIGQNTARDSVFVDDNLRWRGDLD